VFGNVGNFLPHFLSRSFTSLFSGHPPKKKKKKKEKEKERKKKRIPVGYGHEEGLKGLRTKLVRTSERVQTFRIETRERIGRALKRPAPGNFI